MGTLFKTKRNCIHQAHGYRVERARGHLCVEIERAEKSVHCGSTGEQGMLNEGRKGDTCYLVKDRVI